MRCLLPQLDAGQPVCWDDPLNNDLVTWYLVGAAGHPSYYGGLRLVDLCRRWHGALAGSPYTPFWQGAFNNRGWGSLKCIGTGLEVDCGDITAFNSAVNLTMSAMIQRNNLGTTSYIIKSSEPNSLNILGFEIDSGGEIYLDCYNGGTADGHFTSNDSLPHLVTMVYNGAGSGNTMRLQGYLDGVQKTLSYDNIIPATLGNTAGYPLRIGNGRWIGTSHYSNFVMDHLSIWSRSKSSGEVWNDYEDWRRNHIRRLNWLPRSKTFLLRGAAAAAGRGPVVGSAIVGSQMIVGGMGR